MVKHMHFLSLLSSERLRAAPTMEPWNQTKARLCPCGSKRCWSRPSLQGNSGLKIPVEGKCSNSGQLVLAHDCPHLTAGPLILLSVTQAQSQGLLSVRFHWCELQVNHPQRWPKIQEFYCRVCCRFLASLWAGLRSFEFHFPAGKAEDSVSFLRAARFYKVQIFVKFKCFDCVSLWEKKP